MIVDHIDKSQVFGVRRQMQSVQLFGLTREVPGKQATRLDDCKITEIRINRLQMVTYQHQKRSNVTLVLKVFKFSIWFLVVFALWFHSQLSASSLSFMGISGVHLIDEHHADFRYKLSLYQNNPKNIFDYGFLGGVESG